MYRDTVVSKSQDQMVSKWAVATVYCFATLSLEQGMDIKTVSHMLGHTDAGFTMSTYMHVTDSMQENVANTMGNLLGGNVANS